MTMKIYNSNSTNSLLQDLGPFKIKSVDSSLKGSSVFGYKNVSNLQNFGSKSTFGNQTKVGSKTSTSQK